MAKLHLFAHMDRNKVRKGDKVKKFETILGTVGDGNGQYSAHLHYSISEGLEPDRLISYIKGWVKDKVKKYYRDPSEVDFERMFGTKMDVGHLGYGYLDLISKSYGYHPGVDVNNPKGGNSDFGMPFTCPIDGVVVYEWRGWTSNHGWGNVIIVSEDENTPVDYDGNLKRILEAVGYFFGKDYGDKPSNEETDEIVSGLKNAK